VTCGNGVCDTASGETCASCASDCGACDPCGNGLCEAGRGETCSTCDEDCGDCAPEPPSGCLEGDFQIYWGTFHAHTHYSDGEGIPAQAFTQARNEGLDFFWITDHLNGIAPSEWSACKAQADGANTPGTFVAGCGYEMAPRFSVSDDRMMGHINALFTSELRKEPKGLSSVYDWFEGCGPNCVGQFNHPPAPRDFSGYDYFASGANAVRMIEFNGGGTMAEKMTAYFTALRKGWRVSPSNNEDNHGTNWGQSPRATGVWATALDRSSLRRAVRQNRTFSTFDDTAFIRMKTSDGCWMGSILRGYTSAQVTITVRDNPCTATFKVGTLRRREIFVARATQKDGDQLISAPLWYED
jgi:hypothetical protein